MVARWPWRRRPVEARAIQWPFNVGPPQLSLGSGSVEDALTLAPFYASARLLADSVASLPLRVYRRQGDRAVRVNTSNLFDQPSATGTLYDWLFALMVSLVLEGNAYGLVTSRDGFGFPTTIEWLRTDRVRLAEGPRPRYFYDGAEVPGEDMFHVRGFVLPGRHEALSPVKVFRELISSALYAEQYGSKFFENGGFPPGKFKNTQKTVSQDDADAIKARLVAAIRTRQPLVYGNDWEFEPINVPADEAQFISSAKLAATQVASIFGIPPERVGGDTGGSLTYKTQEQDDIHFQNNTVRPWVTRLEDAFFGLIPDRQFVRFNLDATLRVDALTQAQVFQIWRQIGMHNIDELRAIRDLEPLPDGAGQDYDPLPVLVAEEASGVGEGADDAPAGQLPMLSARPRAVS